MTEPSVSAAAASLAALQDGHRNQQSRVISHARVQSWPSPPVPEVTTVPSAPAIFARSISVDEDDGLSPSHQVQLTLYTYKPSTGPSAVSQPSPLPSTSGASVVIPSAVQLSYAALPWTARPGDYIEIRGIRRPDVRAGARTRGMGDEPAQVRLGGEALRGVTPRSGRDGYIFRLGEDSPNVPATQIQVPESVAAAFKLHHRLDVEVIRVSSAFHCRIR